VVAPGLHLSLTSTTINQTPTTDFSARDGNSIFISAGTSSKFHDVMRTRKSNKTKRFVAPTASDEASDGDDVQSEADPEDVGDDEGEQESASDNETGRAASAKKKNNPVLRVQGQRGRSEVFKETASKTNPHILPAYPLDLRNPTRVYTGRLERHSRYSAMASVMYGPRREGVKLIWQLVDRWSRFPVLPPALPPQSPMGILPSPWLAPGFEVNQELVACDWYNRAHVGSGGVQQVRRLLDEQGNRLTSGRDGDMITLLGPWDSQKEFRMRHGRTLTLGQSGFPIEEEENTDAPPLGWLLDIDGLVTSLDWAPGKIGDRQILALLALPHSDQSNKQADDLESVKVEVRTKGSIQLWEFSGTVLETGLARPSRLSPRYLAAICLDWGRPNFIKWCPIPLNSVGSLGILAILCEDGLVRIINVDFVMDPEDTIYGE
jgi:transcription factor C subunit 6